MRRNRALTLILLAAVTALSHPVWAEEPVNFADENLKEAVKEHLGITTDPLPSEMLMLTELNANRRGIVDLTGLETAANLVSLQLRQNQITDISVLTGLSSLEQLSLRSNQIGDITTVQSLPDLVGLDLRANQIATLPDLSGLINLRGLDLAENPLGNNLSGLSQLTDLDQLNLSGCGVTNIQPLAGLTGLTILGLETNGIDSLTPLVGLANLVSLNLTRNNVSDLTVLAALTNLDRLQLSINDITDISALGGLNLTSLHLSYNAITDISVLATMPNLHDVRLTRNNIHDVGSLTGLMSLGRLDLLRNPLNVETCASHIPQIIANNPGARIEYDSCDPVFFNDANLRQTVIDTLAGLSPPITVTDEPSQAQMNYLKFLEMPWGVPITDFTGLEHAVNLEILGLCGIELETIPSGIFGAMPNLWHINVSWNNLTNIAALAETQNLGSLKMQDCGISDIGVLSSLTGLWELELQNNAISDISWLTNLTHLEQLNLLNNPLDEDACTTYLPQITANNPGITVQQNACVEPGGNLLINGGFENGNNSGWGVWAWGGGVSSGNVVEELVDAAVPEPPIEGNYSLHIEVAETGPDSWNCGLSQGPILFEAGKQYTLSAWLKCKQGTLDVRFKPENTTDWTPYGEQVFTMTDAWAQYSITTPVFTENVTDGQITFHTGFDIGEFWIDDIQLTAEEITPQVVQFVDSNLKQAVIEALADIGIYTTDPTNIDMAQLESLTAIELGITDLTGLEYGVNLSLLNLRDNNITDAGPLSGLTNLWWLHLGRNPSFSDLQPLSELTNLTYLRIYWDQVTDLSPIAGLTHMLDLAIQGNADLIDLSPLQNMADLEYLNTRATSVSDLSPLSGLSHLYEIHVSHSKISNLSGLTQLPSLEILHVQANDIVDPSPLAGLPELRILDMWDNQISDISSMAGMTQLTSLGLGWNQIGDVSGLANLISLEYLGLEHNPISDITALSNMESLGALNVGNSLVSDIAPLQNMLNLQELYLDSAQIGDLSPLLGMTTLETLWTQGNPLDSDSHCVYLDAIAVNNPNLTDFQYDEGLYSCEPTPPGENVDVAPVDTATGQTPVTITFEEVEAEGTTSLTTSETAPAPLGGFQLGEDPTFYDISTTATFTGLIDICINYDEVNVPDPEEDLRLLHYENGYWIDCTTHIDTDNNIICGAVTSLSPFALVLDVEAPTIQSISVSPDTLWPVNHEMIDVNVLVDAVDNSGVPPVCKIIGVTYDEFMGDQGDGTADPDWLIVDDLTVQLRAERAGFGDGRVYVIQVACTDPAGNITLGQTTVSVPHDQGQ